MASDIFDIAFAEVSPVASAAPTSRFPSTRSPPQRLDSIPSARKDRSGSVRGQHYSKVPDISQQPLNTLLPACRDDTPHCRPYYLTKNIQVNLNNTQFPPWTAVTKQNERKLFEFWNDNSKFQSRFLSELFNDALHEPIYTICSTYLVSATAKVKQDRELLTWLQETVIEPTVFDEAELSVYEELWDSARMLTEAESKSLAKLYEGKIPDQSFVHFLKDHHRAALTLDEGKSIYSHKWSEVLFHLNKIISRASLMENYAIRRLQEQFVLNIAAEVMFDEAVKYMESEMEDIDQRERIENPPREVKI